MLIPILSYKTCKVLQLCRSIVILFQTFKIIKRLLAFVALITRFAGGAAELTHHAGVA
jgi:hypothetical protein